MTTETQVIEPSQDQLFDAAFNQMADALDNPDKESLTDIGTITDVDGSAQTVVNNSAQLQQPENQPPVANTVENTNVLQTEPHAVDYKALYEGVQQQFVSQNGLLASRLNELSEKYQALKESTQQAITPEFAEDESSVINEVKDLYPEVYKAMEIMLRKEIEDTKKSVATTVQQTVQPLQQRVQADAQQTHIQRILDKHSDAQTLFNSGALRQWVDKLDSTKQIGAFMVLQHGTPEQVINLISDYKSSLSANTGTTTPTQTQQLPTTPTTSLDTREEEIAKRVMQMIGVPSKTPGMNVHTTPANTQQDDYDTMLKKALAGWDTKR